MVVKLFTSIGLLAIVLLLALLFGSFDFETVSGSSSSNILIFLFVNLNILFLLILAFLVGREVVKLVIDRRRNILGSKLRWRLVIPFLGLTTVPVLLLFLLASGLLNRVMDGWFQSQIESSRDASIFLAKSYYEELKSRIVKSHQELAARIKSSDESSLAKVLEVFRREQKLFSIRLLTTTGKKIISTTSPVSSLPNFKEPLVSSNEVALASKNNSLLQRYDGEGSRQFLRVYGRVFINGQRLAVLVVSHRVDPDVTESFELVRESYNEYRQLRLYRNPLRSGYLLTFALVAGMILFAALWLVVQIARGIVEPIERLVRGLERISKGDYEVQLDPGGDDEIGFLIQSFNLMSRELKLSRSENERQRLLVETIVANLTVGVVTVDRDFRVIVGNKAASTMLGEKVRVNSLLSEFLPQSINDEVMLMVKKLQSDPTRDKISDQFNTTINQVEQRLVVTAISMNDIEGSWIYTLLLFDDITDLVKAQQMIAWREVARRIAHEIKNPLTPLKLSAQRLQRRATKQEDQVLIESTQIIVDHVESIKRLADEFSNFARMPTAVFEEVNLAALATEVISSYVNSYSEIQFKIITDTGLPSISLDPEQIKRVLINLLDNAVASVTVLKHEASSISVKISLSSDKTVIRLEVADNGVGISESDRHKIFDPYFTRKKGGTGLGLAIVSSIVAEHHGTIKAVPNCPNGAKLILELPANYTES